MSYRIAFCEETNGYISFGTKEELLTAIRQLDAGARLQELDGVYRTSNTLTDWTPYEDTP